MIISRGNKSATVEYLGTCKDQPDYDGSGWGYSFVIVAELSEFDTRSIAIGNVVDALLEECNGQGIPFTGQDLELMITRAVSCQDNSDIMKPSDINLQNNDRFYVVLHWNNDRNEP